VPPPKVDGVTLRDWAIHYTHRADIWESFVTDFYETAAGDPDVLQVFKDAAARRGIGAAELVADVQNHFLRALLILTHTGLTERLAASLAERHFALGLTPYVYDRTADALVAVATRYGVPANAMKTLGQMIAELKPRLVTVIRDRGARRSSSAALNSRWRYGHQATREPPDLRVRGPLSFGTAGGLSHAVGGAARSSA
jgi:hypothetical protein